MDANQVISEINQPLVKGATAVTAALASNSDVAKDVAVTVATSLVQSKADPGWFWFVVSVPWASIASLLAALYTSALLAEWLWKKAIKPLCIHVGWMEAPTRRVFTAAEIAEQLNLSTDQAPL